MENKSGSQILSSIPVVAAVFLALMVGYLFNEVKHLKSPSANKNAPAPSAGTGGGEQAPAANGEHVIGVNNLKKYAAELGLNAEQFNQCLDGGSKAEVVKAEMQEGSALGVRGTPGFFINGRFLGGAFPFESFKEIIDLELAGKATANLTSYSKDLQDYAKSEAFDPKPKTVNIGNTPVKGNPNAPITIVEYSDFECPFCIRAFPTVEKVLSTYGDKVKFVYKQFPLDFHPQAQKAAEASLCAGEQDKFYEMHDKLFQVQAN